MFVIISDKQRAATRASVNLCPQCRNYFGITYSLTDEEVRACSVFAHPFRLKGPVAKCSDYSDKTKPGKYEMDKMAWAIEPRGKTGFDFVPPSRRKDIES